MGMQKNPYVYMANSYANILSSYGEGLAMVVVESQAVGVLNISSNCKYGPREILMDGDAGVLFTPGDSLELAKAMIDVYENNIDVKKMVQKSTKGLVRFDKDEIKEQVKSLIS
jgi:glycosyltransferase involved in cell wall biosynthesis